ncbi:Fe(3+) ABC transporter substrate-binding protein [Aliidiomarina maris]|uniref:Fe(3+) ABC transporter substrate-binding protein n=1 Tax=Aliidiomarina maris TaxID=531312 RepID=A0A327X2Q6_9GAMM|nr:Fe(3+) ABC transporter substrate-binding protein [Aliidiomarina maris]RAK00831.1 iron(III) transport system substrate-binding protein [Aliidiomarina maris]RUO27180.1 Fe(3+) ABC transporter substrate-binding protein [Aliidiomarina maris]
MKNVLKIVIVVGVVLAIILAVSGRGGSDENQVTVYSARIESLVKPLLDQFEDETGITVNLLTGSGDGLLTRLQQEGANSPADVFITVDAGRLHRAKEAGLFQSVESADLMQNIPEHLRDVGNQWFGLSIRARPIFYAHDRVDPADLSDYLALADEQWRGRICVRSSDNVYNQSLVAGMLAHHGEEVTEEWVRGLVANFARSPVGGDRDQLHAVANGQCDIAIANTYYFGGMTASDDANNQRSVSQLSIHWPAQGEGEQGVHVNVSGIGLLRHAQHEDNAIRLMEFLAGAQAQSQYAQRNQEYPVRVDSEQSEITAAWGEFRADDLPISVLGDNNAAAVRIMNRAGWR